MKRFLGFLLAACFLFAGCDDYDDSDLRNELESVKNRVKELEETVRNFNSQIISLQEVVQSIQELDYITATETTANGYMIHFRSGKSIKILNGENGKDLVLSGEMVTVGIKPHSDGAYYWTITIDGHTDWILDEHGGKIPVQGVEVVTPVIGIDSQGYWTVNYGSGASRIKDADGKEVSALPGSAQVGVVFESVDASNEDYVIFRLMDGTEFSALKYKGFAVTILGENPVEVEPGQVLNIAFELTYATSSTVVSAVASGEWTARTSYQAPSVGGVVVVTAPALFTDQEVTVMASDGRGNTATGVIRFYERQDGPGLRVKYHPNGATSGIVPVDDNRYQPEQTVTVLPNTGYLIRTGFVFTGWNTAPQGDGFSYDPGDTFTISAITSLYAQWDEKQGESDNSSLTGISLSAGKLRQEFDPQITEYDVYLQYSVTEITVLGIKADAYAQVVYSRPQPMNLSQGFNVLDIRVIAENGQETIYSLKILRGANSKLTFDINGGVGETPVNNTIYFPGTEITLPQYNGQFNRYDQMLYFRGWNTRADGTGDNYPAGSIFIIEQSTTLYAKWEGKELMSVLSDKLWSPGAGSSWHADYSRGVDLDARKNYSLLAEFTGAMRQIDLIYACRSSVDQNGYFCTPNASDIISGTMPLFNTLPHVDDYQGAIYRCSNTSRPLTSDEIIFKDNVPLTHTDRLSYDDHTQYYWIIKTDRFDITTLEGLYVVRILDRWGSHGIGGDAMPYNVWGFEPEE